MKCPACKHGRGLKGAPACYRDGVPQGGAIFSGNCYPYLGESYECVLLILGERRSGAGGTPLL